MKVRVWLLFFLMLGCLGTPALPPLLPGNPTATVWAQPAQVSPDGADGNQPDGVVDDGGGDGSPSPDGGLLPDEPMPADSTDSSSGWINSMPTGTEIGIWLVVLLILGFVIWGLYRRLLTDWVRKPKHPANLRALLYMLAALFFFLWSVFWFIFFLAVFGWWMALPFGIAALLIVAVAQLVVKK